MKYWNDNLPQYVNLYTLKEKEKLIFSFIQKFVGSIYLGVGVSLCIFYLTSPSYFSFPYSTVEEKLKLEKTSYSSSNKIQQKVFFFLQQKGIKSVSIEWKTVNA